MSHDRIAATRIVNIGYTIETENGVPIYPVASKMIRAAGSTSASQNRPETDSQERTNTRDVLDIFKNAKEPGAWSFPMYIRTAGTAATAASVGEPQGLDVLKTFFGRVLTASGMLINSAAIDDVVTTIPFDALLGEIPTSGVIKIESELVYYAGVTYTDATKVAGSFTGCSRGYGGTTAASHIDDTPIGMWSLTVAQSIFPDSGTLVVQQDFIHHMIVGCSPDTASLSLTNSDGTMFTVSGQSREQFTLSEHDTNAIAANGATSYSSADADLAEVDMYIKNATKGDDNNGDGYKITAISGSTITITPAIVSATGWDSGDTIEGFLPSFEPVGEVIENRQTALRLNGEVFLVRSTEISLSEPKTMPTDIVSTDIPEPAIPGTRVYSISINVYAKKDKMSLYKASYDGVEYPIEITYGVGLGNQMVLTMPRVEFSTPTISEDGDTFAIAFTGRILGTLGEDSLTMRFE